MKATNSNVIIKAEKQVRSSTIIMPDNEQSYLENKGMVLDVGPDVKVSIEAGDVVLFHKDEGRLIDGLIVLDEQHILAIVEA